MRFAVLSESVRGLAPMYAVWAFFVLMLGWFRRMDAAVFDVARPESVLAWSMTAAWLVAFMPAGHLQKREFVQLPLSRRDVWVCRWWLAVMAPALVMAVAGTVSALIVNDQSPHLVSASSVVLAAFCCAVWGGLSLVERPQWLSLAPLDRLPPHSAARRYVGTAIIVWVLGWLVGGACLPFLFAPMITAAAAAPTTGTYVLAISVGALVLAQYFRNPPLKERPPVPRVVSRSVPEASASHATPSSTTSVNGLQFMYWREVRRCLWILGVGMTVVTGYWWLFRSGPQPIGGDISTQSFKDFLRAYWLLPFDTAGNEMPIWVFLLIPAIGPQGDDVRREIRRLRTLPFSGRSLSHVLMIRTLIGPVMLWTAGLALHAVVLRAAPSHLRLGALLLICGAAAMMHAVNLAIAGRRWALPMVMVGLIGCGFVLSRYIGGTRPDLTATGWILLASALWLSEWAIRTRSLLYSRYDGPLAAPERFS